MQLSLADRALKRRRLDQQQSASYMDTRFRQPTSNVVEQLNSQAKYAIGQRRKGVLPHNLEMQLFFALQRSCVGSTRCQSDSEITHKVNGIIHCQEQL